MDPSRVFCRDRPGGGRVARRDAGGSGATTARAGATASPRRRASVRARRSHVRVARFARRARLGDDDVAAWCDDLARRVRSGASLASALRSATPSPALAPIVAPIGLALDRGDSVAGATRRVASGDAERRARARRAARLRRPRRTGRATARPRGLDAARPRCRPGRPRCAQRPGPPLGVGAHPPSGRRPRAAPGDEPGHSRRGARVVGLDLPGRGRGAERVRMVVDATDHRQVGVIAVACSTVAAAIALLAGRLAPHRRTRRVPAAAGTRQPTRPAPIVDVGTTWVAVALASMVAVAVTAGLVAACAVAGASVGRARATAPPTRVSPTAARSPRHCPTRSSSSCCSCTPGCRPPRPCSRRPSARRSRPAPGSRRPPTGSSAVRVSPRPSSALVDELGPAARPIADGIAAAERYGLPLAPLLDTLSDQAHAARRRLAEAEARRLPVRLSFPLVVCTLPSFVLLAVVPAVMGTISSLRGHPA